MDQTPAALPASAGKQAILLHARQLFATKGYEGASLRDISQAAQVSLGLAYNYFSGKLELLRILVTEGLDQLEAALAEKPANLNELNLRAKVLLDSHRPFWQIIYGIKSHPELSVTLAAEVQRLEQLLFNVVATTIYRRVKDRREVESLSQVYLALFLGASQQYLANSAYPFEDTMALFLQRSLLY